MEPGRAHRKGVKLSIVMASVALIGLVIGTLVARRLRQEGLASRESSAIGFLRRLSQEMEAQHAAGGPDADGDRIAEWGSLESLLAGSKGAALVPRPSWVSLPGGGRALLQHGYLFTSYPGTAMPDSKNAKNSADPLDRLEGSRLARRRLACLLDLQSGACTAQDACRALGLGRSQLYDLRARALQAAIAALEPRSAGRPRKPASAPATAHDVRAQVQRLQRELACARARGLLVDLVSARDRGDPE